MAQPVILHPNNKQSEADAGLLSEMVAYRDHLKQKLRKAFIIAAAVPLGAASAYTLVSPEKDARTNLDRPGMALTLREVIEGNLNEASKSQDASAQRLENIRQKMSRTEMGREVLGFIREHKVKMRFFDLSNEKERAHAEDTAGSFYMYKNAILLNPGSSDDNIMTTIAHEGRHAWQHHTTRYHEMDLAAHDPTKKLIIRRYVEADAFAFETTFALDYESKTGKRLPLGRSLEADDSLYVTNAEFRDRLRKDLIAGVPDQQARLNILKLGFETLKDRGYDAQDVSSLDKSVTGMLKELSAKDADCSARKSDAAYILNGQREEPTWKEIVGEMRKLGNMRLTEGSGNYLSGISDQDIVSLEWMGGLSHIRAPQFAQTQSRYTTLVSQAKTAVQCEEPKAAEVKTKPVRIPGTNIIL